MDIDKNISGPFVEVYEKLIFTKSMILGQWTGASVSSPGGVSPIHLPRWPGK